MANVVELGDAGTSNLVQGSGTNSATFTMPKTGPLVVESVVATVNNTAGADTTATLTIKDQTGEVIATKRQGEVIPAADTGTATFALRTVDDRAVLKHFQHGTGLYTNPGQPILNNGGFPGTNQPHWIYSSGDQLLDVTTFGDQSPVIVAAGVYTVTMSAILFTPIAAGLANITMDFNGAISGFASQTWPLADGGTGTSCATITMTQYLAAGTFLDSACRHNQGAPVTFSFQFLVQRVNVT